MNEPQKIVWPGGFTICNRCGARDPWTWIDDQEIDQCWRHDQDRF